LQKSSNDEISHNALPPSPVNYERNKVYGVICCDVIPCNLIDRFQPVGEHFSHVTLKTEAACFSGTLNIAVKLVTPMLCIQNISGSNPSPKSWYLSTTLQTIASLPKQNGKRVHMEHSSKAYFTSDGVTGNCSALIAFSSSSTCLDMKLGEF
jgi:hypothetical protein